MVANPSINGLQIGIPRYKDSLTGAKVLFQIIGITPHLCLVDWGRGFMCSKQLCLRNGLFDQSKCALLGGATKLRFTVFLFKTLPRWFCDAYLIKTLSHLILPKTAKNGIAKLHLKVAPQMCTLLMRTPVHTIQCVLLIQRTSALSLCTFISTAVHTLFWTSDFMSGRAITR